MAVRFDTIGMGSTTARRLDRLDLGLPGNSEIEQHRGEMAYGNRMYLREAGGFIASPINDQVARTGWSWGTSSFDFDNRADPDIYVANGYRSGKTSQDV